MKVLCVGSNYKHHAQEMGTTTPREPIWFWKPESAIIGDGDAILLPTGIGSVHHEVELAVRIGDDGPDAFTVAIDVTARDLQAIAKKEGRPWAKAKGFDSFLPLGAWIPSVDVDLQDLHLRLKVDEEVRQQGRTRDMTWDVDTLLRLAADWTTLRPGDILLTGTPEGVGPIEVGSTVEAEVVGHVRLRCPVKQRRAA